jgi:hypothetical protein
MGRTAARIAAALAIVWGLVLAAGSAAGIPEAMAAQRLVDGARPLVATDYLAREQGYIALGKRGAVELVTTALPRLADRLGDTPAGLQTEIEASYPDVAAGLQRLPGILTTTGVALSNLQRHHQDFTDGDAFPARGLPRLAASILGIGLGLVVLGLGLVAWSGRRRWPVLALLVAGLLGAVVPAAFAVPHRAQAVQAVAGSLNLSTQTATRTRASFEVVERFHDQLEQQLLPDAAGRLGTTADALAADILRGLDALPAFRRDYPAIVATFQPDVELREHAVDDFQRVKDIPVVALTWTFVAASGAIALAAAAALLLPSRRRLPAQ